MTSAAFKKVLEATGYVASSGRPAPGLIRPGDEAAGRLRAVFADEVVGLKADAVFAAQNAPTSIFKDAGVTQPDDETLRAWHEAAWNIGVAPLLWIITPTDVRLYDCYASPPRPASPDSVAPTPLDCFTVEVEERLRELDIACGRLATEAGAFWSGSIGSRIDRRHRVDRELLAEISALEDRLTALSPHVAEAPPGLARDLAQRFVGRCIFTWYLLDRGLAQPFLSPHAPRTLSAMFATPDSAFALFDWLRATFNGDLFPMDDPGAERDHLTEGHLALIREFVEGRSLIPERKGQGRLFNFRFNAIPVDLISSIYQQFARSSAADASDEQGLHYTPVELVHLTLDPVFEGLGGDARVIDPACGSGAFLVEAFRRLVWRAAAGKPASRQQVRSILYGQLFGVDINRSALGIAAFSLYLAALELDEEPVKDVSDLRFDRLIGETLFEADSLGPLPEPVTARPFDVVVGNPPWTFVSQPGPRHRRSTKAEDPLRPRRSPDQAFLALATTLAGDKGRVAMVMKATPFFSKDVHAVKARSALLTKLAPAALINLSYLRREELFPDANGPALLFFARCAMAAEPGRILVGSIPWTPDFRRTGVFHIGPGEIRSVPLDRVLSVPPYLKAATFGSVRDGWLIERLERQFPTFDEELTRLGIRAKIDRGQGFKVQGQGQTESPSDYFALSVVTPGNFKAFRLDRRSLDAFEHKTLHRTRSRSIFRGPLLLCSKVGSDAGVQRGRYSAAVSSADVLYTQGYFGISFAGLDHGLAYLFSGILNSSMTAFQLALGGPTWGLERPTVEPHDLLSLRMPPIKALDPALIAAVIAAERAVAAEPEDLNLLAVLDEVVFDLYDLEPDERVVAKDGVAKGRHMVFDFRKDRIGVTTQPTGEVLRAYAGQVVKTVNAYLRARGERHLEAVIYYERLERGDLDGGIPGVTAVRFVMSPGGPHGNDAIREGDAAELDLLATMMRGHLQVDIPPYLNERRQLRLYGDQDLFILKPSELRYWTRTAGLNDADLILADHWTRRPDVVAVA